MISKLVPLNKVIRVFIVSDFIFLSGWGLVVPILAIFIINNIDGGDAGVVGLAVGIYWIGKSILQIPIARYLDKNHGEKDDYLALLAGMFLASLVPLGYIFASLTWHVYLLQFVYALAMALVVPSWAAIFTRHIDKGQEALSWSFDSSALGIGAGLAGIVGGSVAKIFGFVPLFLAVFLLGLVSALIFLLIKEDIIPKTKKDEVYPITKPY